jgi:hypothetical protein
MPLDPSTKSVAQVASTWLTLRWGRGSVSPRTDPPNHIGARLNEEVGIPLIDFDAMAPL